MRERRGPPAGRRGRVASGIARARKDETARREAARRLALCPGLAAGRPRIIRPGPPGDRARSRPDSPPGSPAVSSGRSMVQRPGRPVPRRPPPRPGPAGPDCRIPTGAPPIPRAADDLGPDRPGVCPGTPRACHNRARGPWPARRQPVESLPEEARMPRRSPVGRAEIGGRRRDRPSARSTSRSSVLRRSIASHSSILATRLTRSNTRVTEPNRAPTSAAFGNRALRPVRKG